MSAVVQGFASNLPAHSKTGVPLYSTLPYSAARKVGALLRNLPFRLTRTMSIGNGNYIPAGSFLVNRTNYSKLIVLTRVCKSMYNTNEPCMKKQKYEKEVTRFFSKGNLLVWTAIYGVIFTSILAVKNATISAASFSQEQIVHADGPVMHPLVLTNLLPSITPTPTPFDKKSYIQSQKHGDIILRIWTNESGRGQYDGLAASCIDRGGSNEFGYDPQDTYCFPTFQDSVKTVNAWWDNCLTGNSLADCLLEYSGNSDTYINKFLSQSNN